MKKSAGVFEIFLGSCMLIQWAFFYFTGNIPELVSEPVRISFHIAGETVTAVLLIISGIMLLKNHASGGRLSLFALGMVMYSMIVSPGYFAQRGQWGFVIMFAALISVALFFTSKILKS